MCVLTIHCFVCTKVEKIKKPKPKDDDEFIEVVKINFEKLLRLIKNGKILDGKTIAAALKYESKFWEKHKKYAMHTLDTQILSSGAEHPSHIFLLPTNSPIGAGDGNRTHIISLEG